MNIGTLAPLLERFDYDRANLLDQEIHDALVELAAWRDLADDMGFDTPQEMEDHIDNLQDHQCKNHEDYGDLKEFFDDCVSSLNEHWPSCLPTGSWTRACTAPSSSSTTSRTT